MVGNSSSETTHVTAIVLAAMQVRASLAKLLQNIAFAHR